MKKIILIFIFVFIKLNAYEYLVYFISTQNLERFYYSTENGLLRMKYVVDGEITNSNLPPNNSTFWAILDGIKINGVNFTRKSIFDSWYKADLIFLNDLYMQAPQQFLNYLYNENRFSYAHHLNYENYELLYDSEGLAVESIVGEVWAGLYDDSERGVSGRLYSSGGQLLYVNGKHINWMESQMIKLMDMVNNSLRETVSVLGSMVPYIVAAVFVLLILYYVVSVGRRAIMPSNVKVRKRFLGSHNNEC